MTRKIKALGLAIIAVTAMSMAASAQAFEMHTTHNNDIVLTGQQSQQFVLQTDAGKVTCTTADFEGTVPWVSGSQVTGQETTLTPTLSGCQTLGLAAVLRMNGCKFVITNKTTGGSTTAKTGYVDLTGCTVGKQVEVIGGGGVCITTVPEQHHLGHVVFQNTQEVGKPEHIEVSVTLTGLKYEFHGMGCGGTPPTVLTSNGVTQGGATFRAYEKTGTHQVTEHNHQFQKNTHNSVQVGILAT
jgi:hypothetical protein